jgi:CheY-like chemotaxis protein
MHGQGAKPVILVADDDPTMRMLVRRMVYSLNERVLVRMAVDGSEALAIALRTRPALLILDDGMPRLTGLRVLEEARRHLGAHTPPAILLTARGTPSYVQRMREEGFQAVLTVPFNIETLKDHVRGILGGKHTLALIDQPRTRDVGAGRN